MLIKLKFSFETELLPATLDSRVAGIHKLTAILGFGKIVNEGAVLLPSPPHNGYEIQVDWNCDYVLSTHHAFSCYQSYCAMMHIEMEYWKPNEILFSKK